MSSRKWSSASEIDENHPKEMQLEIHEQKQRGKLIYKIIYSILAVLVLSRYSRSKDTAII